MLPTRIDWQLLFQIARKHGVKLRDIVANTNVKSPSTLSVWGDTSRGTQPRYDLALEVYNYLWLELPDGEAERSLVFSHKSV